MITEKKTRIEKSETTRGLQVDPRVQRNVNKAIRHLKKYLQSMEKRRKISRSKLAEILGLPNSSLTAIITQNRIPRWDKIIKIANFEKCSLDEMFGFPLERPKHSKEEKEEIEYSTISDEELRNHMMSYVDYLLKEFNCSIYELGLMIGLGPDVFRGFKKEGDVKMSVKQLNTRTVLSLYAFHKLMLGENNE